MLGYERAQCRDPQAKVLLVLERDVERVAIGIAPRPPRELEREREVEEAGGRLSL